MTNGELASIFVGAICGFGSGLLFYGIGAFGARQKKPMNFWAGKTISSESVTDIPAYNHACARLWKWFSAPCWLFGILSLMLPLGNWTAMLGLVDLVLWGTAGLWCLIRGYKEIERQYICKEIP